MYSIRTQKRMSMLLYLLVLMILVAMPFRYIHLMLHDMSQTYLIAKYLIVAASAVYLTCLIYIYVFRTTKQERQFQCRDLRDIFLLAFIVAVMGVVAGFVNGYQFYYIVGDTFRHVSPWVFFFFFLWILQGLVDSGGIRAIERFLAIMAIVGIIEAISTIVLKQIQPDLRISTNLYLWSIVWCLYQKKYPFLLVLPILIISVLASMASGKRSPIVLVAVIVAVYSVYLLRLAFINGIEHRGFVHKSIEQLLVVFLIIIIVVSCFPLLDGVLNKAEGNFLVRSARATVTNVYEIFSGKTEDMSWEGRWVEWDNIVDHMKTKPETWLWGTGFGSEIEAQYPGLVLTPDGKMHTVHQAWAAYFLRSGVLGLLLFSYFFAKIIWVFIRGGRQYLNWQYYTVTFVTISIIASFSSNVMLDSFGDAFFCALLYSLAKSKYPVMQAMSVPVSMDPVAKEYQLNELQDEFIEYSSNKAEQSGYAPIG